MGHEVARACLRRPLAKPRLCCAAGLNITDYRIYFKCPTGSSTCPTSFSPSQASTAASNTAGLLVDSSICLPSTKNRQCGDQLQYAFTQLTSATTYEFAVGAFNGYTGPTGAFSGWSTTSAFQSVTTTSSGTLSPQKPPYPAYAIETGGRFANIFWQVPTEAEQRNDGTNRPYITSYT